MEGSKRGKLVSSYSSVHQFVSVVSPLVDLEKEAEIAASIGSAATKSLELAQKRGSVLSNLKCSDAQVSLTEKENSFICSLSGVWCERGSLSR
jgi:hypothetical protein